MSDNTTKSPFKDELSESIFRAIMQLAEIDNESESQVIETFLQQQTRRAFDTLAYDFVTPIIMAMEKEGIEFMDLFNWTQFFDACASLYEDEHYNHQLILIPFMASSAYGLPYGRLSDEVLDLLEEELTAALPSQYQLRINTDILSTDHFAISPVQMNRLVRYMVESSKPGVSTFIESEETAEDVNNLVADIRLIALVVSAPNAKDIEPLDNDYAATTALQKRLGTKLRRLLREQYVATRIDLVMDHGTPLNQYLDLVAGSEAYTEALWMAPPFILVEAGKLFRHFALKEAIGNLKQSFDLKIEDLQVAVGAFFESPSVGCLALAEYRVGISKKGENKNVLQGVSWPVFNTDHIECQHVLERTLRLLGFDESNMKAVHDVFPIEDDDEDMMLFPTWDGELAQSQAPEMETTTPTPYTLN